MISECDPLDGGARRDLYDILEERYGRRSTILTSQVPVDKWHEIEAPIIEDQELSAIEAAHDASMAAVAAGQREISEEFGDPMIKHRAIVAAGLVAESARKPTLADATWPAQDQIVVRIDPRSVGELAK